MHSLYISLVFIAMVSQCFHVEVPNTFRARRKMWVFYQLTSECFFAQSVHILCLLCLFFLPCSSGFFSFLALFPACASEGIGIPAGLKGTCLFMTTDDLFKVLSVVTFNNARLCSPPAPSLFLNQCFKSWAVLYFFI